MSSNHTTEESKKSNHSKPMDNLEFISAVLNEYPANKGRAARKFRRVTAIWVIIVGVTVALLLASIAWQSWVETKFEIESRTSSDPAQVGQPATACQTTKSLIQTFQNLKQCLDTDDQQEAAVVESATPVASPIPEATEPAAEAPALPAAVTPGATAAAENPLQMTESSAVTDAAKTTASPEATTASAASQTPIPPNPKESTFAAGWHLTGLTNLFFVLVFIPWLVLLGFALQSAQRICRALVLDLQKLGIPFSPDRVQELDKILVDTLQDEKWRSVLQMDETDLQTVGVNKARRLAQEAFKTGLKPLDADAQSGRADNEPLDRLDLLARAIGRNQVATIIDRKIGRRFTTFEYIIPLVLLTFFLSSNFTLAYFPQSVFGFTQAMIKDANLSIYIHEAAAKIQPAIIGVLSAYVYSLFQIFRRYHRSDITPSAYWEFLKRVVVVYVLTFAFSAFVNALKPSLEGQTNLDAVVIAFAFIGGIFPTEALVMFVRMTFSIVQAFMAQLLKIFNPNSPNQDLPDLSQRLEQNHPLYVLDDLDQWEVERINEEGIIGLQGLATADLDHFLIWTPFSTRQIVDWVDQALLHMAAGAEADRGYVKLFRQVGLRGATDLLDAASNEAGKVRLLAAIGSLQSANAEDGLLKVQAAALRAHLATDQASRAVCAFKDQAAGAALGANGKTTLKAALAGVRLAGERIDDAAGLLQKPADALAAAKKPAQDLLAQTKSVLALVKPVEEALKTAQDQYTAELVKSLQDLYKSLADGSSSAIQLSQNLVDLLDRLAAPFSESDKLAVAFTEKCKEILKQAETAPAGPPAVVSEAAALQNQLLKALEAAKEILPKSSVSDTRLQTADQLIEGMTSSEESALKAILAKLTEPASWEAEPGAQKIKGFALADQLAQKSAALQEQIQAAARISGVESSPVVGDSPAVLSRAALETMLTGLERNSNLRRIQRYLTLETNEIERPGKYIDNNEWALGRPGD